MCCARPTAPLHVLLCRAADTQGDISQARGQLGQLLFEFSQVGRQPAADVLSTTVCGAASKWVLGRHDAAGLL